jgi:hypothetical protein
VPNDNPINVLEWLAFFLLVAVGIFTGFKVVSLASPFAMSFFANANNKQLVDSFVLFTGVVFVLMSTTGLVYFKLQSEDEATLKAQKAHPIKWRNGVPINIWQIPVFSPRLFPLLTYFVAAWLFVVSSVGHGTVFEKYLPVVAELALTSLVADMLLKLRLRNIEINTVWRKRIEKYDDKLKALDYQPEYLTIVFQELREAVLGLERTDPKSRFRKWNPNSWLEFTSGENMRKAILSEYNRLTAGLHFANDVLTEEVYTEDEETTHPGKRVPPANDKMWTVNNLRLDFKVRGLKPSLAYSEKDLAQDYMAGYGARTAWRKGAKLFFGGD